MSRIPQPSSSRPSKLPVPASLPRSVSPAKPAASARTTSPAPVRVRTKSVPKTPTRNMTRTTPSDKHDTPSSRTVNIREAIALKRAEAKTAMSKSTVGANDLFDDFLRVNISKSASEVKVEDVSELGRWSLREVIERSRSSGVINLASRALPCLPSALFELHLGIKPDALPSVPQEPPLSDTSRHGNRGDQPAWFEAQDLQVLKAWNNNISEIQHEISLFGSLITVDLHQNKIESLPGTFADLTALTTLDLSHNALTTLPVNIFSLPNLVTLDISHNRLASLPFNAPFSEPFSLDPRRQSSSVGSFFAPIITRSTSPLPRLVTLAASHNRLTASGIDYDVKSLPPSLTKLDLSANPLSSESADCASLLRALGQLNCLKELLVEAALIGNDALPSGGFKSETSTPLFPALCVLDLGETAVTRDAIEAALSPLKRQIMFEITTGEPPEGVLRVTVGKKILKEPWELEAERHAQLRNQRVAGSGSSTTNYSASNNQKALVEPLKEAWEVEAEQGLTTEGGRRRARAAVAAAEEQRKVTQDVSFTSAGGTSLSSSLSLSSPQYYNAQAHSLTLPPLPAPVRSHARSFSLAGSLSTSSTQQNTALADIALPTTTLPLRAIGAQGFAQTLRILILSSRKFDQTFSLLDTAHMPEDGLLPLLEELSLDDCGLGDKVTVVQEAEVGSPQAPRSTELTLPLIRKLFPSLQTLDLSYNVLTSGSLTTDALMSIIMSTISPSNNASVDNVIPSASSAVRHRGLRHLRLRGNRITGLEGFKGVAELFRGHQRAPGWHLEELDLRDNEIGRLPAELGLLPLDVLLVDGNTFRVPQRKVWEREGTKGLLSWLRGRIE